MDKIIKDLIEKETARQKSTINLIASENFASEEVLSTLGCSFSNKYAEGYPYRRYYAGVGVVDDLETICQKRALELFNLDSDEWDVNVQALSGANANLAVYSALVPVGGKLMGLDLSHGGHLSHGSKVSMTGKIWDSATYFVEEDTNMIDYTKVDEIAKTEKPDLIVAGFSAYPFEIDWEKFYKTAKETCGGAYLHADISHISGLIVAGKFSSPFEYADTVVTTTHKSLRGPRSALIFSRKGELSKKVNSAVFPGLQGGPHMNQVASVAVALQEAIDSDFKKYINQVLLNAKASVEKLRSLGMTVIGTDSHLFLIDLVKSGFEFGGDTAQIVLEKNDIIVNKNAIPFDKRKPSDPSGIRIGTYAETTRGLKEEDFMSIMEKIDKILRSV